MSTIVKDHFKFSHIIDNQKDDLIDTSSKDDIHNLVDSPMKLIQEQDDGRNSLDHFSNNRTMQVVARSARTPTKKARAQSAAVNNNNKLRKKICA